MPTYTNISLAIEPELVDACRAIAVAEDRSVSSVFRNAVRLLIAAKRENTAPEAESAEAPAAA